jgi:hypothetical protein
MTLSTELTHAILALDSYNRGYAPYVDLDGSSLGGYTILIDSEEAFSLPGQDPDTLSQAGAASFYAAAYQDATGNIVISYRGTDAPFAGDIAAWTCVA